MTDNSKCCEHPDYRDDVIDRFGTPCVLCENCGAVSYD